MISLRMCKRKAEITKQVLTRDKLIELLVKYKLTREQVGKSYGISTSAVGRLLKDYDINLAIERKEFRNAPSKINKVLSSFKCGGKVTCRKDYMGMW